MFLRNKIREHLISPLISQVISHLCILSIESLCSDFPLIVLLCFWKLHRTYCSLFVTVLQLCWFKPSHPSHDFLFCLLCSEFFLKSSFRGTLAAIIFAEEINKELKEKDGKINSTQSTSSTLPQPREGSNEISAEKYFLPFELACQSKSPRIVVTALDCLQVSWNWKVLGAMVLGWCVWVEALFVQRIPHCMAGCITRISTSLEPIWPPS